MPGPAGEELDGADEVEVLHLPDEGDDVAPRPAAPAAVEPSSWLTLNDGVFSPWNGQSPPQRWPDPLSCVYS